MSPVVALFGHRVMSDLSPQWAQKQTSAERDSYSTPEAETSSALRTPVQPTRTYATLLEALNRHCGKGQQKVTAEHVHVHEGGQAIVGNVEGVGCGPNRRINPMQLHMHRAKRCGARTRSGKPCQSPAMANGRCRMHGGPSPGAPKGNRNAFKHGRYTAEEIARRREISALIRVARSLDIS